MSLAVSKPVVPKVSESNTSDAASKSGDAASRWAEALKRLPAEDQEQFSDRRSDMLAVLEDVSAGSSITQG
jgi:hypothetical protein